MQIPKWNVFVADLQAASTYANPFWDVEVEVHFTSPSGRERVVDAFWDGGRNWRARFDPDEVGRWHWRSVCSREADTGLHDRRGELRCARYGGDNPLHRRGPIRVADGGRTFAHADGTPFFWLGDTAWNGALRAGNEDWDRYLRTRRDQGFTAVQFVGTHWRGHSRDAAGEVAFEGTDRVGMNPAFFHRMDPKVAAVNAHGLVAAPVILWANSETDPGQVLSEAAAARVARYLVARWGAHSVVWILAGDGDYRQRRADRWKRIGRAVFDRPDRARDRLVTMHPCGINSYADDLRDEPWLGFLSYQSGHGDGADHLRWNTTGAMATDWRASPTMPVVNLEPNYELHLGYHSDLPHPDQHIRRAAYWSLLVAPPAGVTYGCNPIWAWPPAQPEVPEGHEWLARHALVPPWHKGLVLPGIENMTVLRGFFEVIAWARLLPAQQILADQPGEAAPERFVAAAKRDDDLAVLYTPVGGEVHVKTDELASAAAAAWFDPRSGEWASAGQVSPPKQTFQTPDANDWVLCLGPAKAIRKLQKQRPSMRRSRR